MKPVLKWVEKYLKNIPPSPKYDVSKALKGGKPAISGGGCAIYPLDVYGTADTKPMKSGGSATKNGPRGPNKRTHEEINKTLNYIRKHYA